jgi:quinoprotein glucose dehydrogenase
LGFGGRASALLVGSTLLGVVVALVNYFQPGNGISGTPGALLVIVSTVVLALVGFALHRRIAERRRGGVLLHGLAFVLLAGTVFAAWLLESHVLVVLVVLAALGWLGTVLGSRA